MILFSCLPIARDVFLVGYNQNQNAETDSQLVQSEHDHSCVLKCLVYKEVQVLLSFSV